MITIGQEVFVLGKYLPRNATITRLPEGVEWPYYMLEVHPEPIRFHPQRLEYTGYVLERMHLTREAALTAQRQANRDNDTVEKVYKLHNHYRDLHGALLELELK